VTFPIAGSEVRYTEHVKGTGGSPRIRYAADGVSVTRTLDVDWPDLDAAARALLGYAQVGRSSSHDAHFVQRVSPDAITAQVIGDSQLNPYVYATEIDVEGLKPTGYEIGGDGSVLASYEKARLTVTYSSLPYDVLTDAEMLTGGYTQDTVTPGVPDGVTPDESFLVRYVTRRPLPAVQMLTLRGGVYKYVLPTAPTIVQGLNKTLPRVGLQLTWHNVPIDCVPCSFLNPSRAAVFGPPPGPGPPVAPWTAANNLTNSLMPVETCLGHVNAGAFVGCYPGTLLFTAAEFRALRNRFGMRTYDCVYTFLQFSPGRDTTSVSPGSIPAGHCHVFRPADPPGGGGLPGGWIQVSTDGITNITLQLDGHSPYDFADFRNLFRPP